MFISVWGVFGAMEHDSAPVLFTNSIAAFAFAARFIKKNLAQVENEELRVSLEECFKGEEEDWHNGQAYSLWSEWEELVGITNVLLVEPLALYDDSSAATKDIWGSAAGT